MSQVRDLKLFDAIVILIFILVVGYFAKRSHSPSMSSMPGVQWSEIPVNAPELLKKSELILEGDPLPPESIESEMIDPEKLEPNEMNGDGSWE